MYAQDSIELLQNSGIQFKQHESDGIEPLYFAELLMTSGVVLIDSVKWVSFHRSVQNKIDCEILKKSKLSNYSKLFNWLYDVNNLEQHYAVSLYNSACCLLCIEN